MRNLVISKIDIQKSIRADGGCIQADCGGPYIISPDPDSNTVFMSDSKHAVKISNDKVTTCFKISDCSKHSDEDDLVSIEWLPDRQALLIVTRRGDFFLYHSVDEVELVASISDNLQTLAWSPDLELAALVSGGPSLLMITASFEPILEVPIFTEEFGNMEPVTVGWGRKETQFHGSAGKGAAVATRPDDTAHVEPWDDGRPRVTWRPDGQVLAVGAVCPATGGRRFMVFARDGSRLSTSELVAGLGQSLAWRASSSLITAVQRLPNKLQAVFFEKNGLRHGEFTLSFPPPDTVHVRELLWSPASDVLAVWLEARTADAVVSRVQLWTTGNYHWYCKQEHVFPAHDWVLAVCWHPGPDCRLLVATRQGRLLHLSYQWQSACAAGSATAAVVDGCRVLVTPLAVSTVPPPMSDHQLQLPAAVNALCRGPPHTSRHMWVVTSDQRLHAFRQLAADRQSAAVTDSPARVTASDRLESASAAPRHEWLASCTVDAAPAEAATWAWVLVTPDRLACAARAPAGYQVWLLDANLPDTGDDSPASVSVSMVVRLECAPVSLTPTGCSPPELVVHTEDGRFLLLDTSSGALTPMTHHSTGDGPRLPVPAHQVCVVSLAGDRRCVLALTSQHRLYMDSREVLAGCTAFSVGDDFLLVTTLEQTLRSLPLTALHDVCAGGDVPWSSVWSRRLERGARLVTAVGGGTSLVLQMPRGNLEVIHPRPLVLARLARLMDSGDYYTAYAEMRRHRINLNLLVDHAPDTFPARCDDICRSLRGEPNWLCVFISELSDADVTRSLYRDSYPARSATATAPAAAKVDETCRLVRDSLERLDRSQLILPILTTMVRHSKPQLEQALRVICQLRECPPAEGVTAAEALRYLVVLVDVEELYSAALATYDFDLAIMVAEKSQKDPKEYLALLNELRVLPEQYRRYRVDAYLRRPLSALRHLVAAGADHQQEALKYMSEHRLYEAALRLYKAGSAEYRAVCGLYADYLDQNGHCWEAGTFYVRAGAQTSAVDALRRAGAWRDCLHTATQLGMPRDQFWELCDSLASELLATGHCSDAADIYERHLKRPEEQVACLLEGRLWENATQACHQARKPHLVGVLVGPALQRAAVNTLETLARIADTLEERQVRLAVVRKQQEQDQHRRSQLSDRELAAPESDLYSDTSSVSNVSGTSGSSSRTFRSSKSRRKQERKKYSLREGSSMEDLALIAACHSLITEAYSMTDDIGHLLRALVQRDMDTSAADIQAAFSALLVAAAASATQVWPQPSTDAEPAPVYGPTATANTLISRLQSDQSAGQSRLWQLEPHLRYPPLVKNGTSWKLHCLQRPDSAGEEGSAKSSRRPDAYHSS